MTPPTHAASSMCFAPAPEVLDPPPAASGGDVQGHHGRPPEAKESPARRAEERPRTRAAPAAPQGGQGTSQAAPARPLHPSSGCCRWSAAAAPQSGTTATRAPHACHDEGCTAGHGATGGREERDRPGAVLQGPKGRGEACEGRWRGAHLAPVQSSSVAARHLGVLGRLRVSWRRSAA